MPTPRQTSGASAVDPLRTPEAPRLLILLPGGQPHRLRVGPFVASFREAPLTGVTLAALVPADLGFCLTYVDGSVSPVPLDDAFDLVAISVITGMAPRAYALADHYRARGAKVVLGGVHVTLCPDEALRHADCVVTGFAERTWPRLLRDFRRGSLQSEYHDPDGCVEGVPPPRRDLQKRFGYIMPNTVFATRGCRNVCDFCAVPAARQRWQTRPVADIIADVRRLPGRRFAFNDVNLIDDREYAVELFTALAPLKKEWGGLATTRVAADAELLDLLARSGCRYLLLGFESVTRSSLCGMRKAFNAPENYRAVCDALHAHGIAVHGCFIFGLDTDTPDVFAQAVDAVNELRIDIPRYALYTPFPGTAAHARLKSEERLLHERWEFYDTQHVVIRPKAMSPLELDAGFATAWRQSYSLRSILHRTAGRRRHPAVLAGNLAYGLYARRLPRDPRRFPEAVLRGEGSPACM